jgi:hypothetical protein
MSHSSDSVSVFGCAHTYLLRGVVGKQFDEHADPLERHLSELGILGDLRNLVQVRLHIEAVTRSRGTQFMMKAKIMTSKKKKKDISGNCLEVAEDRNGVVRRSCLPLHFVHLRVLRCGRLTHEA